jgi:HlyD family secretion protein
VSPTPPGSSATWRRLSARTRWLLGAGVLVSMLVGWLVLRPNTKAAQVVKVQRADLTQTVVATGRINAAARIDVGSEVTATVQTGGHVSEGDRCGQRPRTC